MKLKILGQSKYSSQIACTNWMILAGTLQVLFVKVEKKR